MSTLSLSLLGPFQASLDGQPLDKFRTSKVQALLIYLVVEADAARRREALMELLWPGLPQKSAQVNLRQTLYQLRRAIPELRATDGEEAVPFLLSDRHTVQINPAADVRLDVTRFRQLLRQRPTPDQLTEAVALYRGDFLCDFYLPDSAEFEDWAAARRAEFQRQALDALGALTAYHIEGGAYDRAQAHARRALEIDHLRESAYRGLMTALALDGQREAALAQYQLCRERLQAELGAEPSAEMMALVERIRAGELKAQPQAEPKAPTPFAPEGRPALQVVRGYELLERVGTGGFGEVYRAYQPSVGRTVAVKVILPQYARQPEFVQRFDAEAQLVARLEHPHIVPLYDYWRDADAESAYLVMRWLPGGNLHDALGRGPWTPEAAAQLLDQIAGALAVAHREGVVHRDVKPENILLDRDGNAYLSDFGIAKDLMHDTALTAPDAIPGSAWYISPEQAQGRPVTPQSDLYSLGLVVYQVLAGQHPFSSLTPGEQLIRRLTEPLPPLSERRPELSGTLETVLQRATAHDPAVRYPDALAFARAFREALASMAAEVPAVAPRPARIHNLPTPPTPFIGREREMADLDQLIGDPNVRLITIVGSGGIGKTRLALAAAERQLTRLTPKTDDGEQEPSFANGVFFVPLAALSSADQIVPSVAEALDFRLGGVEGESRALEQQILDYLREKRLLLVLDNLEHLLDSAHSANVVELVADILRTAPEVHVLATSRERLLLHEEQVYPIQGLEFLDWERPADTAEYTAAQLFLGSARRVQPSFELAGDELTYLARVCRLLEGMPLAIELAAGWVDVLSLADIASEIQRGIDFLETEWRDVPARHRSMRAVFDASWQRLSAAEQAVFARLCVFHGGFTRDAAREVASADLRTLSKLVNKSLLQFDTARDRYELHELLRQYGAERLATDPETETDARDRHSDYYCAALKGWQADLKGSRAQEALDLIDADIDNVRAAWEWAALQGHVSQLDGAMDGLCSFYWQRYRLLEGIAACQLAANVLAQVDPAATVSGDSGRVLARALTWQGFFYAWLGNNRLAEPLLRRSSDLLDSPALSDHDTQRERAFLLWAMGCAAMPDWEQTRRAWERSVSLYRVLGDQWWAATVLRWLGHTNVLGLGDLETARQKVEESVALLQSLGYHRETIAMLFSLGWLAREACDYDEAQRWFEEALALSRTHGELWGQAQSLSRIGGLALFLGQFENGRDSLERAIEIRQQVGDRGGMAVDLVVCGSAHWLRGRYAEADSLIEKGLAIFEAAEDRPNKMWALGEQGQVRVWAGRYQEARALARTALTLVDSDLMGTNTAQTHRVLGWVALAREAYVEAQGWLAQSVAGHREAGYQYTREWLAVTLPAAARAGIGLGHRAEAQAHLLEALEIVLGIRAYIPLLFLMPIIPVALVDAGGSRQVERAVELYALAESHPFVANGRLFEDIAGRTVKAAAAAALTPDVVQAAQARGRALDWWDTAEGLLTELRELGWDGLDLSGH